MYAGETIGIWRPRTTPCNQENGSCTQYVNGDYDDDHCDDDDDIKYFEYFKYFVDSGENDGDYNKLSIVIIKCQRRK